MSDVVKPPSKDTRPSRWMRLALVVSLSLNLLLIGLAVGAAVNFRKSGGPPRNFDVSVGLIGRALAPEDRRAVGEALRASPRTRDTGHRELAAMRDELTALLRADPFDAAALSAMLERQGQLGQDVRAAGQTVLVARIAAMTAAERAALADRMDEQSHRRPEEQDRR